MEVAFQVLRTPQVIDQSRQRNGVGLEPMLGIFPTWTNFTLRREVDDVFRLLLTQEGSWNSSPVSSRRNPDRKKSSPQGRRLSCGQHPSAHVADWSWSQDCREIVQFIPKNPANEKRTRELPVLLVAQCGLQH